VLFPPLYTPAVQTALIRPPRPADAEQLAEIWIEHAQYYAAIDADAFQVPEREGLVEWLQELIDAPAPEDELSLVAEVDGKVVGFVEATIAEPLDTARWQLVREVGEKRLLVTAFGVRREYWRRGLGTKLLHAAEQWGREKGAVLACLDTYASSPVSVPFYEKLGYSTKSLNYRKRLT
jgi:GNAT superfamily N-acetyltransferase